MHTLIVKESMAVFKPKAFSAISRWSAEARHHRYTDHVMCLIPKGLQRGITWIPRRQRALRTWNVRLLSSLSGWIAICGRYPVVALSLTTG